VAQAIDNSGRVVGTSGSRAFIWQNGTLTELSGRANGYTSSAQVIPNGVIGGYTQDASSKYVVTWDAASGTRTPMPMSRLGAVSVTVVDIRSAGLLANVSYNDVTALSTAKLYSNGTETDLGAFNASVHRTQAAAMNAGGQIVGSSLVQQFGSSDVLHPFLWENGSLRDLGTLGSSACSDPSTQDCSTGYAAGINASGTIVGTSYTGNIPDNHSRPFIWQSGTMKDLGVNAGHDAYAMFINDQGQIAGQSISGGPWRGWRWSNGTAVEFATLGDGWVSGMNVQGSVIGATTTGPNQMHAFVWNGSQMIDLGAGPLGPSSAATAINDRGDVVGWSGDVNDNGPRRAVLWKLR
jgi:probable HAF family extracellular repeat protein